MLNHRDTELKTTWTAELKYEALSWKPEEELTDEALRRAAPDHCCLLLPSMPPAL